MRQACALLAAVRHPSCCHTTVDPLWRPRGGADTPLETRQVPPEAPQAHPARPHLDTRQRPRDAQAMEAGEAGNAVKKRHASRTRVEAVRVRLPGVPRAAGHRKPLGRLTLGWAVRVPSALRRPPLRTCAALPALRAILMDTWLILDDGPHGSRRLLTPRSWGHSMA